jgi:hypothetical protein
MKAMRRGVGCMGLVLILVSAVSAPVRAETGSGDASRDQRNAALMYWQAFALIKEAEGEELTDKMYGIVAGRQPFDKSDQAISELLDRNEMALRVARRASRLPHCDFQPDFTRAFSAPLAHLAKIRNTARLLALQGKQFENDGRWSQAVENYLAALRMGLDGANDGTVISALVCVSVTRLATNPLNKCLTSMPIDAKVMEGVLVCLAGLESAPGPLRKGLEGEIRMLATAFAQMDDYAALVSQTVAEMPQADRENMRLAELLDDLDERIPETSPHFDSLQYEEYLVAMVGRVMQLSSEKMVQDIIMGANPEEINALAVRISLDDELLRAIEAARRELREERQKTESFMNRLLEQHDVPYAESIAGVDAIQDEVTALPASSLAGPILSSLRKYYGYRGEFEEALATARLVALLQIHKARQGDYPASLTELPEAPDVNPRTGKPFEYEKTEGGYRLTAPAIEGDEPRLLHEVK